MTIAKAIRMSSQTVPRAISELRARGCLKVSDRYDAQRAGRANEFDFSGLIDAARPYAGQLREQRKLRAEEKAKSDSRKPGLRAVK